MEPLSDAVVPRPPTGRDLEQFLARLKKEMQAHTHTTYMSAYHAVLKSEGSDWSDLDVSTLDLDDLLNCFGQSVAGVLKPRSIRSYKSRFKTLMLMFLDSWRDPAEWEYSSTAPRANYRLRAIPASPDETDPPVRYRQRFVPVSSVESDPPIRHRFPIRPRLIIELELPVDLRPSEADRLKHFIDSLTLPCSGSEE